MAEKSTPSSCLRLAGRNDSLLVGVRSPPGDEKATSCGAGAPAAASAAASRPRNSSAGGRLTTILAQQGIGNSSTSHLSYEGLPWLRCKSPSGERVTFHLVE